MGFLTSTETQELFSALVDAQAVMPIARKSSKSRFHRYATVNDLIQAARPVLAKYGLAVTQGLTCDEHREYVTTRLIHKPSGQWIEGSIPVVPIALAKEDIQSYCGHISYLQRYSYKLLVGIIAEDEDDDDGETAMKAYQPKQQSQSYQKPYTISKEEEEQLEYELAEYPELKEKMLKALNISTLSMMPKAKFFSSLERIRERKQLQKTVSS